MSRQYSKPSSAFPTLQLVLMTFTKGYTTSGTVHLRSVLPPDSEIYTWWNEEKDFRCRCPGTNASYSIHFCPSFLTSATGDNKPTHRTGLVSTKRHLYLHLDKGCNGTVKKMLFLLLFFFSKEAVLNLAGIQLISLITAHTVLCFGLVTKTGLITQWCFSYC